VRLSELDYELPEELIAQEPAKQREAARLLVMERHKSAVEHAGVTDLPRLLEPSLFVFNDTRVIPARVFGHKDSGGVVEMLLVERISDASSDERWLAMIKGAKRLKTGSRITCGAGELVAVVEERRPPHLVLRFELSPSVGSVLRALDRVGTVPLPPYIRRAADARDADRYQTVYARNPGAVAAPTAGLHFSEKLLSELSHRDHSTAHVTLHVGPGTFAPIKGDDLSEHVMHRERYDVPASAQAAIARAKAQGRKVVAVGTTVMRTLEAAALDTGEVSAGSGATGIFISPPFQFRVVDGLLTNFHLPRSTLLALVMAFGGVEPVRNAYRQAVAQRYRFFSYGDAMLLRPPTR
jgi:S-adenosylmethionine:tRNA ribosyltransferase-isomerase